MDKIRKKEIINRARADLMHKAIQKIREIPDEQRQKIMEKYQNDVLKEAEIDEITKKREQSNKQEKPFKIVFMILLLISFA